MSDITVLGSGMAGYGAAYHLTNAGQKPDVYDKNSYFGGHTNSYSYDAGFVFDEGPHISFTKDERMQNILAGFIDNKFERLQASANNYYQGHWIKHPAQCNLHGLPVELTTQIIKEFAQLKDTDMSEIHNYEQWLRASFGDTFAETFPMPYGEKYHTTTASNMSTEWLGPRLYKPDLEEVIRGALTAETEDVHYISNFRYPSKGGFKSYLDQLPKYGNLQLDHKLIALDPKAKNLTFENGKALEYKKLLSSLPLTELIPMIKGVPDDVRVAASLLSCTSCVIVNLGINTEELTDAHWTYIYDEDICFTRLSFPSKFSPNNAPNGSSSIQAELYFSDKYKPRTLACEDYIPMVIADLQKIGILKGDESLLVKDAKLLPYANIVFDLDRAAALDIVQGYLKDVDIHACGRYGEWAYIWTDESFVSGEKAAESALSSLK